MCTISDKLTSTLGVIFTDVILFTSGQLRINGTLLIIRASFISLLITMTPIHCASTDK